MRRSILLSIFLTLIAVNAISKSYVGIDISHHQGRIVWTEVAKENIDFVYIKATEGATYVDPCFHYNMKGATDAGFYVGAYHYFRMTSSAKEQFYNFKKTLDGYTMSLVPMIDVETSDGKPVKELQDSLNVFIKLIKDEYGCPPMIYGTQRSYNTYCAPAYNNYHLYVGRYGPDAPVIKGTGTYSIWQYTENAIVKGIPKPVDMCRFNPKYTLRDIKRTVSGIDLSHHNQVEDWGKISADFVYLKATEGATWTDPKFNTYLKCAKDENLLVGAYHFMTTSSEALEQFESFKKIVPKGTIDLIPMLDIERQNKGHIMTKEQLQKHVREWVSLCEGYYGRKPIIYSSLGFYIKYLKGEFDDCLFWCGDVGASINYVNQIDWAVWQYEIGPVDGVKGEADKNKLHKDFNFNLLKL